MKKKKRRNCIDCMGYCNMLGGGDYRCGLGFEIEELIEGGYGTWGVSAHPFEDKCVILKELPNTREAFVEIAASLGLNWDIDDVLTVEEYNSDMW